MLGLRRGGLRLLPLRGGVRSAMRFSSTRDDSPAVRFLETSRALSRAQALAVVAALRTTGSSPDEVLALAQSLPQAALVQLEQSQAGRDAAPRDCELGVVVPKEGNRYFSVRGHEGETLQQLVERGTELKDYLECACGGNMTCSTCHVYVKRGNPPPPDDDELDMVDMAWEPREKQSRLGCQLKLSKDYTLVVEIPLGAFNHFR